MKKTITDNKAVNNRYKKCRPTSSRAAFLLHSMFLVVTVHARCYFILCSFMLHFMFVLYRIYHKRFFFTIGTTTCSVVLSP